MIIRLWSGCYDLLGGLIFLGFFCGGGGGGWRRRIDGRVVRELFCFFVRERSSRWMRIFPDGIVGITCCIE